MSGWVIGVSEVASIGASRKSICRRGRSVRRAARVFLSATCSYRPRGERAISVLSQRLPAGARGWRPADWRSRPFWRPAQGEAVPILVALLRCMVPSAASAEAGGLQGVVSLDDVAQPLLEGPVATVGVRMKAFHEGLVLRLDGRPVGHFVEAEHVERAPNRSGIAWPFRLGIHVGLAGLLEILALQHPERIDIFPIAGRRRGAVGGLSARVDSHGPGGTVADDRVLLVGHDRIVGHAGKIIVGCIIGAHVIEAELPIAPLLATSLRGTVEPGI